MDIDEEKRAAFQDLLKGDHNDIVQDPDASYWEAYEAAKRKGPEEASRFFETMVKGHMGFSAPTKPFRIKAWRAFCTCIKNLWYAFQCIIGLRT